MDAPREFRVRPYRRTDRSDVRRICAATGWLGEPAPRHVGDDWIWAEFWTRYFTDRECGNSWVVVRDDGRAAGYLTGTPDERRVARYLPFLAPSIVWRILSRRLLRREATRRALAGMLRSLLRGEMKLPPAIARAFPATFHFNLLPEARGRGLGRLLLQTFLARMRSLHVGGVHVQTLSVNERVARFLTRAGFHPVQSRPTCAFAHAEQGNVSICTWVLPL